PPAFTLFPYTTLFRSFLESDDPGKDIYLYINSPGGSVYSGLAIYDTMQYMQSPVNTMCMGMAASMGALLLATGAPGKRSALPNSDRKSTRLNSSHVKN